MTGPFIDPYLDDFDPSPYYGPECGECGHDVWVEVAADVADDEFARGCRSCGSVVIEPREED